MGLASTPQDILLINKKHLQLNTVRLLQQNHLPLLELKNDCLSDYMTDDNDVNKTLNSTTKPGGIAGLFSDAKCHSHNEYALLTTSALAFCQWDTVCRLLHIKQRLRLRILIYLPSPSFTNPAAGSAPIYIDTSLAKQREKHNQATQACHKQRSRSVGSETIIHDSWSSN